MIAVMLTFLTYIRRDSGVDCWVVSSYIIGCTLFLSKVWVMTTTLGVWSSSPFGNKGGVPLKLNHEYKS